MPNPNFRSKINISTKDDKIYSTNHLELFCAKKNAPKNTQNIREMRPFRKSAIIPLQNPYFGSKIRIPKNMLKSILQII